MNQKLYTNGNYRENDDMRRDEMFVLLNIKSMYAVISHTDSHLKRSALTSTERHRYKGIELQRILLLLILVFKTSCRAVII